MEEDYLSKLDEGQHQAVTSEAQNTLCLAGAGSGKTRVLTTRVFYLANALKVDPENILAITFTKNAAVEMRERLARMGVNVTAMWCRTFHSMCYKILAESSDGLKLDIIDETEQGRTLKNIVSQMSKQKDFGYRLHSFLEENNWPMYLFMEEVFKVLHSCKNHTINHEDLAKRCEKIEEEDIQEFYRLYYLISLHYKKYLLGQEKYDFSDLINLLIKKLKSDQDVLIKYQEKFKYILVDEFQDVDIGQVRLLKYLTGSKNNLFVVGDDWQSIYGFRGGDVRYILDFKKNFPRNNQTIILPYNYRSDGNIVNAASRAIRRNKKQHKKKIKSFHDSKVKIKIFRGESEKHNVGFVIGAIKNMMKRNVRLKKIMILARNWKNLDSYISICKKNDWDDVSITTIHGAKGLERAIVFFVGLHRGRGGFPNVKEDNDIMKVVSDENIASRIEEERRCFYVGVTRAKKLLYLMTIKDKESVFIKDVPKRYRLNIKSQISKTK